MSLCECGHDFTDHQQTDAEYLCVLCSWCDGYRKTATEATVDLPAGGTPEGLAQMTVMDAQSESQSPDPVPLPEQPMTEAGRITDRWLVKRSQEQNLDPMHVPELRRAILVIEAEARAGAAEAQPEYPPLPECDHAADCICIEFDHTHCCGNRRVDYLARSTPDAIQRPPEPTCEERGHVHRHPYGPQYHDLCDLTDRIGEGRAEAEYRQACATGGPTPEAGGPGE